MSKGKVAVIDGIVDAVRGLDEGVRGLLMLEHRMASRMSIRKASKLFVADGGFFTVVALLLVYVRLDLLESSGILRLDLEMAE